MASFQSVHVYAHNDSARKPSDLGKFTTVSIEIDDNGCIAVVAYPHKRVILRSEQRKVIPQPPKASADDPDVMTTRWRAAEGAPDPLKSMMFDWFEVTAFEDK